MKLTKAQREQVRMMFDGRCAYCGQPLGDRWHADHFEPVHRAPSGMERPENDRADQMMPACGPCNIDKATFPLEEWRMKLERGPDVLMRNHPTYRHCLRFGLVQETRRPVVFYFETYAQQERACA